MALKTTISAGSTSSSSGGSTAAVAYYEKPTGSVTIWSSNNNETLYTVPEGKYFKGNIIHKQWSYPPKINNNELYRAINIDDNNDSYNNYMSHEFRLYAGDVVKSGASGQGGGGTKVQGAEFDL